MAPMVTIAQRVHNKLLLFTLALQTVRLNICSEQSHVQKKPLLAGGAILELSHLVDLSSKDRAAAEACSFQTRCIV